MSNKTHTERLSRSESGMVAIFVSMVMIVIISLVVLGFAQISRRNQRSNLDTQLSTQAYYAAESGVNDALGQLKTLAATLPVGTILPDKTTCDDTAYYNFNASNMSKLVGTDVTYSCVLIDPTPSSITYRLGNESTVIPLSSASGQSLKTLTLTWTPEEGMETDPMSGCFAYNAANVGRFPDADTDPASTSAWSCKYAALRTDLLKATTFSRAGWQANTTSNVLEPMNTSTNVPMPAATDGQPWPATCTDVPRTCRVTITGLTEARYFLRVSAIYRTTSLTITGTDAAGPIEFNGSQAKIDVTGKARDVLRRIVVAVDLTDANTRSVPDAAINSGDSICKRFRVTPGYFEVPEDYDGAGGNTLCEAQTSGTVQAVAVSGRADFETCDGGCGGGSGPPIAPVISWYGKFLNTSDNDPNDVKSCVWDFDDAKYGGTNSIATTSCYYGDTITHLFYPNNYPGPYTQCRLYNVKLSVTLNDGTVKTKQITIRMPGGTSSTCLTFV